MTRKTRKGGYLKPCTYCHVPHAPEDWCPQKTEAWRKAGLTRQEPEPEPAGSISWADFKRHVEAQGVTDSDRIGWVHFRSWLRRGMNNVTPKVRRDKNSLVEICE